MSDFITQKWNRELIRFLSAKSQFILWGNIHDVYPIELQDSVTTLRMDAFINSTLRAHGYSLIVKYEPLIGFSLMDKGDAELLKHLTKLESNDGTPIKATLPKAAEIIETLVKTKEANCAVILNFASRIHELCAGNGNDVNEFFITCLGLWKTQRPSVFKLKIKKRQRYIRR